jgi:hypothetical protein
LTSDGAKIFDNRLKKVKISLSPYSVVLNLPDQTSQTITATMKDKSLPLSDQPLVFTTDFGSFADGKQLATAMTDSSGNAAITLSSPTPGTARLTVWIDANGNGALDPGEWTSSTTVDWLVATGISLDPPTATVQLPDENQVLTATVLDQHSYPMQYVPVTFTTTLGSIAETNPVITDENGLAMVTVSSSTDGLATVTTFVDTNKNGALDLGELNAMSKVTWIAAPSSPAPSP